jgi:hypothetical protein
MKSILLGMYRLSQPILLTKTSISLALNTTLRCRATCCSAKPMFSYKLLSRECLLSACKSPWWVFQDNFQDNSNNVQMMIYFSGLHFAFLASCLHKMIVGSISTAISSLWAIALKVRAMAIRCQITLHLMSTEYACVLLCSQDIICLLWIFNSSSISTVDWCSGPSNAHS